MLIQNYRLNNIQIQRFQQLIELAKQKINNLLQLEDDWKAIEHSEARDIPKEY